jgi:hypothetical protein
MACCRVTFSFAFYIIQFTLLRKIKWTVNRRAYKILISKPEGEKPLV